MSEDLIIQIQRESLFTLAQARTLLPIVATITHNLAREVDLLLNQLEALAPNQLETAKVLEQKVNEGLANWHSKMKKLGVIPRGLWTVDFDFGEGFFCWQRPEADILYWRPYESQIHDRRALSERASLSGLTVD